MAFALAMGLATPILYVLCDIVGLPLFTFHPATNRVDLFWAPGRSGEGPAMYWYGWTATVIVVAPPWASSPRCSRNRRCRHSRS